jgi:hypothetical protein
VILHGVPASFSCAASVREKQLVAFALMVAFAVIMRTELGQSPRQWGCTEQNQLGQAFLSDGMNPAFRKCVQIRASSRKRGCVANVSGSDRVMG